MNLCCVLALSAPVFLGACHSDSDPSTPADQTGPAEPGPYSTAWCATAGHPDYPHTVFGQIFDAYSSLVASNSRADLFVEATGWDRGCSVGADQSGQFVAYVPDSKISIRIVNPGLVQPCAVAAQVSANVALQVEVMSTSTLRSLDPPRPQSSHGISLRGLIFEAVNGVRTPISGAEIWVGNADHISVATTVSDQVGEYFVCNLPTDVVVYVSKPGYFTAFARANPPETPTLDIALERVVSPDALGSGPPYSLVGRIENVDVAARTLTLFGIRFSVSETLRPGFTVSLDDLAIGNRVHVLSYENRYIFGIEPVTREWFPEMPDALIEGQFGDLSPPTRFTLHGVADWVVQVTATNFFGYHWLGDPQWPYECGAITVSADQFWQLATQPKPSGVTTVWSWGHFESGIFLAESVGICFPAPP
jgi:hypothetical protein